MTATAHLSPVAQVSIAETNALSGTTGVAITSESRLERVRELWARSQKDQLEIGRLLYEERAERISVGGAGVTDGFHQWLRDAGIPKTSAYRRIAEYEISIGERAPEDTFDKPKSEPKPVPFGTTLPFLAAKPTASLDPTPTEVAAVVEPLVEGTAMCSVCSEHPHRVNEPPFDYSNHPELQATAASRVNGMGLARLRELADGLNCQVSSTADGFRLTFMFREESEVREFLQRVR